MKTVHKKRHLLKTITWRIVGTIDTILIAWVVSGDWKIGMSLGGLEFFTKFFLYYFHERIWFKSSFFNGKSRLRHILKTFTWRILGTIDTVLLAWYVTGDPTSGLSIGSLEMVSKMILYYLHEEIWYRSSYGIEKNDA